MFGCDNFPMSATDRGFDSVGISACVGLCSSCFMRAPLFCFNSLGDFSFPALTFPIGIRV